MKWILEKRYSNSTQLIKSLKDKLIPGDELIIGYDDGFLSRDEMSPYRYFVSKQNRFQHEEKGLFYIFLSVPKYWEIRANYQYGLIVDKQVQKANIYFTQPIENRNVKVVKWLMEDGWVYRKDYYDKFGLRYFSEFIGRDGRVESRCYYSDINQEIIVEQPLNEFITLLDSGQVIGQFYSYQAFIEYFIRVINSKTSHSTEE